MKLFLPIGLVVAIVICGCARPQPVIEKPADDPATPTAQAPKGGGSGVQPMVPGAGVVSPVSGSESLDGSGMGGIGQSAKEKAKKLPGAANNPSPTTDTSPDSN